MTSRLLDDITTPDGCPHADSHLGETGLLQSDQRGAREGVSGCLDYLLIHKAVMEDVKDRRRRVRGSMSVKLMIVWIILS